MNCSELRKWAPLYLTDEIGEELRRQFAAHLAECPACEREMEQQAHLDARLAAALGRDLPDSSRVERAVCRQIASERSRRRWMSLGSMAAAAGVAVLLLFPQAPRAYKDAARDHRAEVVEKQPRRWRTGSTEVAAVAAQAGLSYSQATSLAPEGYTLEHAKICGLAGERVLHLVFASGAHEYSVYVRPHRGSPEGVRLVKRGSEEVAGMETGRFTALVVTAGSAAECKGLARFAAARL